MEYPAKFRSYRGMIIIIYNGKNFFSRYRLHLPTPHPVDPNVSSAKWHTDTSTLEISLRLVRELDDINF